MDAMTYVGLARHIIQSGDWSTLHYTQQAYSNFYQHPPLAIWLLALGFKLTGVINELTAKIFPYLFALATLYLTYLWSKKITKSAWSGFLAAFILLSSTRYIKFAPMPMLDGFLTLWFVLGGFVLLVLVTEKNFPQLYGFVLGLAMSLGFLTKGMPILALVAISLGMALWYRSYRWVLPAALGAILPLLLWIIFCDGGHYLQHYWVESVRNRLGGTHLLHDLLEPWRILARGYWPWLPFYGMAALAQGRSASIAERLAFLMGLCIMGGYGIVGNFLEHYLVPFFPFAAITTSTLLYRWTLVWEKYIEKCLIGILFLISLAMVFLPLHIQGDYYLDPKRQLLRKAAKNCHGIHRIYLSEPVFSSWFGLAIGSWLTPWDPYVIQPNAIPDNEDHVLLVSDAALSGWEKTALQAGALSVYQRPQSGSCPAY